MRVLQLYYFVRENNKNVNLYSYNTDMIDDNTFKLEIFKILKAMQDEIE